MDVSGRERTVLFLASPVFDAREVAFWRRLHEALQCQGLRLVLSSITPPSSKLEVAHIPAVPSIDTFWPRSPVEPAATLEGLGLDARVLLAREDVAGNPAILPAIETYRRQAVERVADTWLRTLAVLDPAVVVVWNGHRAVEMILDAVSRWIDVPVLYVERAPVAQTLFVDEGGLSAASDVARRAAWDVRDPRWHDCAIAVSRRIAAGGHTWWEQPDSHHGDAMALRRRLGIPADARVVLFASQLDGDTQQYLFSPHFSTNESAFRWLLDQLRGHDDIFLLGKQHPKCSKSAAFARALAESGVRGTWRTDVSIDDALAVADRVAAVNSTVLYEALARERPVLSMGGWLLGGRGAAYEVRDVARGREVVEAWLRADDAPARQQAWREGLAFLMSSCLYTYEPELEASGMLGARDLAERIGRLAARARGRHMERALPNRTRIALARYPCWFAPSESQWLDLDVWQRAHTLRSQLIAARAAADRGRRLVIWGAGQAGRVTEALLARIGVTIDAFVTSTPQATHVGGRPLLSPSAVCNAPRDVFVLVASVAGHEIVPALVTAGATPGEDFFVLDCDVLADASRDLSQDLTAVRERPSALRTEAAHTVAC